MEVNFRYNPSAEARAFKFRWCWIAQCQVNMSWFFSSEGIKVKYFNLKYQSPSLANILSHRLFWIPGSLKGFHLHFLLHWLWKFQKSLNLEHKFAGHCFVLSKPADHFVCPCLISKTLLSRFAFKHLSDSAKPGLEEAVLLHLESLWWMMKFTALLGLKQYRPFELNVVQDSFHSPSQRKTKITADWGKTGSVLFFSGEELLNQYF